ncbi:hypothetical protein [Prosthecobacter sp.]|uniref:hypothetical protein n=1 Tax=Prosthecobacter sp. TaxID=1965333 RepID=UPI002AB833EC|nr:hypothetical protein [Prosthecobacter sp.]MDZ4405194.1 hypothetical protein [Prosthecobacter sp.]
MRVARTILILAAGGAVLAPLCVLGHGAEFLSAKLTLLPDAEVLLEITADYAGNPLIADEAAAQEALIDPVRLSRNEMLVPLAELSAVSITQHDNWAEFAPASYLPSDTESQPHTLITAAWRWRSEEPEIVFEMPKGKLHDVLLWTRDQTNPDAPPKWMLLLAGDKSKAIAVHWPPWWQRWQAVMASSVFVLALGYFVSRNFTLRQRTL